jgi:hypothetical protein
MKRIVIGLALVITLVATYFTPGDSESVPVVRATQPPKVPQDVRVVSAVAQPRPSDTSGLQIRSRTGVQDLGDVFVSRTWTPTVKPTLVKAVMEPVLPPAVQEAPPLPFRFLGRWIEDGDTIYFLQFNDRNLPMRIGDSIDKTYTLDSANGGVLSFTYLPLSAKQTLAVGEVN